MAAISTLINPLGPADDELLTFWNNDSGDLVLVQRKGPSKPTDLIWTKTAKQTGIVKNPSSIVALQYQGLINVYGITSGATSTLKRLSPTIEPLKYNIPITQVASLAGAVTEDFTQGWLYYLAVDDNDATVLNEYSIDGSSDPVTLEGYEPAVDTYLAATCWGGGKRCVFFQKGNIRMVDIDAGRETKLASTKSARKATPLAACTAPDTNGNETRYLYYVDGSLVLQRLTITADEKTDQKVLNEAPNLAAWSQLAVTPGKTHNFISYVTTAGQKQKVTIWADKR
ncbi:hypothetical protein SLS60_011019 [Paraconiothyrium brasiliense]|uniref:Uncharacterized protein n=1 Tax=Paraconiothyrium brasiliense TaxID=300254 RepID=A0ABR3QKK9_9PLEO